MSVAADIERLLVGQEPGCMVVLEPEGVLVHREVVPGLVALREAAAKDGITLEVASGFRDFQQQLNIWNQKARGQRPLLDAQERELTASALSPTERLFAMLRWSALPGASRHHWGTDVDVFDRSALPQGSPQLRRDESTKGAVFARLHQWLDEHLRRFEFFRPYDQDRGGVSPEPWHLSHIGLARALQATYSLDLLRRVVGDAALELKDVVLPHLDVIYRRYIVNVGCPPAHDRRGLAHGLDT
jgi:LAS superfamily LD-carboxypeptidase LdcB